MAISGVKKQEQQLLTLGFFKQRKGDGPPVAGPPICSEPFEVSAKRPATPFKPQTRKVLEPSANLKTIRFLHFTHLIC